MVDQRKSQPTRPAKVPVKPKSQIQDDSIMGTNNSSIVSKRSVERLYFPDEPHYFRFFVKKPQRRAPLINRGYWLRMKAIDYVVRQFLEASSKKQRIVINLGCGYDPLPWQCLSRYPAACVNVKFIDVDYRDLIVNKREVVLNTPELLSKLTNIEKQTGDMLLRSDQYLQVGCDLRDLPRLEQILASIIDLQNSVILFTAEVSITYMNVEAADALIQWASTLPETQFCLLEQILPGGIEHPFAQTMMAHFAKLRTPLGAVQTYPTTHAQKKRFEALGWLTVSATNLWQWWSSPEYLTSQERASLDSVEPFDEWEEFALFGCHYFLLVADNAKDLPKAEPFLFQNPNSRHNFIEPLLANMAYSENPKAQGLRRFAATLPIRVPGNSEDGIGNFAGMGASSRIATYDIYAMQQAESQPIKYQQSSIAPSSRVCHTITALGETGSLLVGGRSSPDDALADCWLYHKYINIWERVDDLPQPQYRHSALDLGNGHVLVSSGRRNSRVIGSEFFVWSRQLGWRTCINLTDNQPPLTYGAVFSVFDSPASKLDRSGILAGGLSNDGVVEQDVWEWNLCDFTTSKPIIDFRRSSLFSDNKTQGIGIARFGATTINHNGRVYVLGGVVKNEILNFSNEVSFFSASISEPTVAAATSITLAPLTPRPLLIGASVASRGDTLVIMGGSAVCFSFGTFWNKGCFTLYTKNSRCVQSQTIIKDAKPQSQWRYCGISEAATVPSISAYPVPPTLHDPEQRGLIVVSRVMIRSANDFHQIVRAGKPVIIEGSSLGSCTDKWTTDYLKGRVGIDQKVVVHEAGSEHMDFQSKNFSYVTRTFGDFIDQADNGGQLYLRSLSSQDPSQLPADIKKDFPSIADDFCLPSELASILESFHSSPLRISGPVNMWLHYDVMANVLCQIRGSKRLLLFPPSDVKYLGFEPGASSSNINVFDMMKKEGITHTHPHEVILHPGDILFLPPLWLHTASPTSGLSIAVNIFFRNLRSGYAAGKDVYGNRDLQAYEKGRQDISKVVKTFESLPLDVREFYLGRLAREFEQLIL